jgi:hypothetical protein
MNASTVMTIVSTRYTFIRDTLSRPVAPRRDDGSGPLRGK